MIAPWWRSFRSAPARDTRTVLSLEAEHPIVVLLYVAALVVGFYLGGA